MPAGEQAELAAHLDACPACQHTVETLAVEADSLFDVARRVGQEPPTQETALHAAIVVAQRHSRGIGTAADSSAGANAFPFLDPPAAPGQLGRLGHYAVLEVVGRGGMGVVFKALDERLQRVVAIKVLSPQYATSGTARQRFQREAKAAAAVSHDHVVPIYHVEEANGIAYLVMPLIVGKSLEERIEKGGPLPLEELLRIGTQIAAGLAAAHKQGLVHRDIKPANILLENGVERVKITDFGLARAVDDASLTQSGVIAGTPLYMSPEQARGEPTIDARSDLFSLGSVLYAMATGRPPFRATGSMAVLKRVCEETPRPMRSINRDVPDWLEAIVAKLHAKWPGDRFQSAQEVADLLGQHLAHLQEPQRVPRPAPVCGPVRRRRWGVPVGVAIAALVLLVVAPLLVGFGLAVAAVYLLLGAPDAPNNAAVQAVEVAQPMPGVANPEHPAVGKIVPRFEAKGVPEARPPQPKPMVAGWDIMEVDPTGMYRFTRGPVAPGGLPDRVKIAAVPGDHDDNLIAGNFKAPRLLHTVEGDFSATVKVLPFADAGPESYLGAGLLLWHDQKHYVRFLIARATRLMGRPGPHEHTHSRVEGAACTNGRSSSATISATLTSSGAATPSASAAAPTAKPGAIS